MPATPFAPVKQGHVYHCFASSFLLITHKKHLETEDTIVVLKVNFVLFLTDQASFVILFLFSFKVCQMLSVLERPGLQTGHFSTCSFLNSQLQKYVWECLAETSKNI